MNSMEKRYFFSFVYVSNYTAKIASNYNNTYGPNCWVVKKWYCEIGKEENGSYISHNKHIFTLMVIVPKIPFNWKYSIQLKIFHFLPQSLPINHSKIVVMSKNHSYFLLMLYRIFNTFVYYTSLDWRVRAKWGYFQTD